MKYKSLILAAVIAVAGFSPCALAASSGHNISTQERVAYVSEDYDADGYQESKDSGISYKSAVIAGAVAGAVVIGGVFGFFYFLPIASWF